MSTTEDDSMQLLDFELLFGSAPTLTENYSIIEDVGQNLILLDSPEQVRVQNDRNSETINYKAEYLKTLRCLEEKDKEIDQIRRDCNERNAECNNYKAEYLKSLRCLEEKDKEIDQIRRDYDDTNAETNDYKAEYLKTLRCLDEKNKEIDQIHRDYDEKNAEAIHYKAEYLKKHSDYDRINVLYHQNLKDFTELQCENKKHALEAIEVRTNLEKKIEELKMCQNNIIAIENQYSVVYTRHQAAWSNINQLTKYVEKLESHVANLENINQSSKEARKRDQRNLLSTKYKLKTYEEDLYSLAGKLDCSTDKKRRDRETQHQISKYTKKKFYADLENIDSESVDTGRGSSCSNYSPAYSINFSPLNMTENYEQKMKDASTSPLQTNETFSELKIKSPSFDVGTKPLENKSINVDSSKENIKTVDTASSPITFVDDIKITTVDTASSPITFVDDIKITTVDTASSPITFVDDIKITTVDTASSPINFVDDIKITTVDTASSPITFVDDIKITTVDTASSPITFVDDIKITTVDTASSPITFVDDIKITTVDTASSPITFVDDIKITTVDTACSRRNKDIAISPIYVANPSSPSTASPIQFTPLIYADVTIPASEIVDITRPLEPTPVTSPVVQTTEMTRLFKPVAVTSPVAQTPEMTRPLQSVDVVDRSTDKTPEMNRSLDPTVAPRSLVKIPEITMQLKPTAVSKHAELLTGPNDTNDVNGQSLTTKVSVMARPFKTTDFVDQEGKTTTSEDVISLVNNNISVISKTPDLMQIHNAANVRMSVIQSPSRPICAVARRPLIKTKTPDKSKHNENIKIFSSEKILTKSCIEIQSDVAQDNHQERDDDLEVRMILNKFSLDWNVLSPMSITPDLDEESLVQSKSDLRNDETERQTSAHSRSQISKESDSYKDVITPNHKKLTIPSNKSNTLKHKINEDNPLHLNNIIVSKPHSIPPITHTPVYNENERQGNRTIHLRKRNASVKICENTKSNNKTELPQSISELASNISSLESQSDLHNIQYSESNSLSRPSRNQLTQSQEPIKKEYLHKEKQIDSVVMKPPGRWTPERIKTTIPTAQSKTTSVPQTKTKLQPSPIHNMSISKEPQSNTPKLPERRRSERIKSTIAAAQSKTNSVPQTRTKLQSSLIDNMSITKEPQSNRPQLPERSDRIKYIIPRPQSKTKSVPQTQTKLQSSPIDNMSISKEPQSNTRVPPIIRRSERVKSTIPSAQSTRNSVPQEQMKLQSSPIDKVSISKEPRSNTRSGCAPIISNPEYGRKRTICRSMEHNLHSKREKSSECYTSKLYSSEIGIEDKSTYSYSTPSIKRISRVNGSVSTNTTSVPNIKESENITDRKATETINKDLSYTPASKRAKLADDKTGLDINPCQNTNENDNTEMSITHASTNDKNNCPEANLKSTTTAVSEQSENEYRRDLPDYYDIEMFDSENNNLKTHINGTHNHLDEMIVRYGSNRKDINKSKGKYEYKIAMKIEKAVAVCVSANPNKYFETLLEAAAELKSHSDISTITGGLYRYLNKRDRKQEFVPGNKNRNNRFKPTPTKYVKSLMDIINMIDKTGLKLWERALDTCRFMLFRLDKGVTRCFDVIESVTHLFVHMCQYNGRRNSKFVIFFMLTAMYCANYRALIIVKNCLDLVPEILPHEFQKEKTLYSMNPLIEIFIFLLHFYNCKDEHGKIQQLRFTLKRRYGYDPTQENFDTILYKVKQTVMEINDHYLDNSMLQFSILILAKRKGTLWCHKNIVQNIILPIIRGEIYASKATFRFCLTIITKLVKPYNKGMIVHSEEVVNSLMDIIEQSHPQEMKDEIICGLMSLNMQNVKDRIDRFLKNWDPPSMLPKLSKALKKYLNKRNKGR